VNINNILDNIFSPKSIVGSKFQSSVTMEIPGSGVTDSRAHILWQYDRNVNKSKAISNKDQDIS